MKKILITLSIVCLAVVSVTAQNTAKEWYDKAVTLNQNQQFTDAVEALKKSVALNASYTDAWYLLGWCYNELGKYNDAISALKNEAKHNPDNKARNNFEMGFAYSRLLNYDEAIEKFNAVISLNQFYSSAYKERGYCYLKKKDYEKALDDYNQYAELEEEIKDPDFYHDKGWCENELEQYNDAIESLTKSINLDDTYSDTYSELGYAYYKISKNDEAIKNYRIALTLSGGKNYNYTMGIANTYYDNLKNYDSALVYLEKCIQLKQSDQFAYYKLGFCYNQKEQYEKAISSLQKALSLNPNYNNAIIELGYAKYKLADYDAALVQFRSVMQKDSKSELSRYYAGFCYYLKKDMENLQKMIDELTALNTTNSLRYAEKLKKYKK